MAFARFRLPLFGLLAGVLFSAMRAPLGLDWTQLGLVDSTSSTLFRAAALVAVALFMDARRPAFRAGTRPLVLLPCVALGFLVHGLLLSLALQPGCRLGIAIGLLSATGLLWLVAGRIAKPSSSEQGGDLHPTLGGGERSGLFLASLGATLSIETALQHLRLLGQGLPADDTIFGSFFLIWISLMVVCFGFSIRSAAGGKGTLSSCALALAATLSLYSLSFLNGLDRDGLWFFLKGVPLFNLDPSFIATWPADAWIAATTLVPIGLLLGIAFLGARHPGRLAAILIGSALGLVLRPYAIEALSQPLVFPADSENAWAWQLVSLGSALAGLGAMLCARGERGIGRLFGSLAGLAAGATPLLMGLASPFVIWSFSPWLKYDVNPQLVIPSANGIISIEPRPGGSMQVNIDRQRVTPSPFEQNVDALRLRYSIALVGPELRESGKLRVLLLGQITPERDSLLRLLGVQLLDRSAAWYEHLPAIEGHLFDSGQEPLGHLIAPAQARARLRRGDYDLVIAMPSGAPDLFPRGAGSLPYSSVAAPIFGALKVPEGTIGVAWVDASAPLHTRSLGEQVILAMDHMEQLSVGVLFGDVQRESNSGMPLIFQAGDPLWPESIWMEIPRMLALQVPKRIFAPREALLRRLSQGDTADPGVRIAQALEQHFALQTTSSPFENPASAVEWEEEVFAQLFGALGTLKSLDPFSRALGEDLFWLLTEKRLADFTIVYGEALADHFAPWPAADRALARAYQELLEPEESLRFWERVVAANPYNLDDHMRCADAAIAAEVPQRAVQTLRQALGIQPGRFDLRRALGLALQAAGDPEGERLLHELLDSAAEDNLIRAALGMELIPELEDEHEDH